MKTLNVRKLSSLAVVLAALGWGSLGTANAATCTVDYDPTNPDASMSGVTSVCGYFDGEPKGEDSIGDWDFLDKAETGGGTSAGDAPLTITSTSSGQNWLSGTWSLSLANLNLITNDFMLVLKDGATGGTGQDKNATAFWFLVDENLCTTTTCSGDWGMYGLGGVTKQLSYLAVYTSTTGGPPPIEIPEPGSLALLGFGLLGLWGVRRKQET